MVLWKAEMSLKKNTILEISCSNHQFSRDMLVFRGVSIAIHSYDGCYPRWFKVVSIFQKKDKKGRPNKNPGTEIFGNFVRYRKRRVRKRM